MIERLCVECEAYRRDLESDRADCIVDGRERAQAG